MENLSNPVKEGFSLLCDDIATEILVRLSNIDLSACRCVSRRFNILLSNPSFLLAHSQWSAAAPEPVARLFFQHHRDTVDPVDEPITCILIEDGDDKAEEEDDDGVTEVEEEGDGGDIEVEKEALWDFLPEKVVLMASCNGLLCCRSYICPDDLSVRRRRCRSRQAMSMLHSTKEVVLYVCNPITKEWIAVRPNGCDVGDSFGLAFYPFGTSNTNPHFKLVGIQCSKYNSNLFSFVVYSSETGRWTTSKRFCYCDSGVHKNNVMSVGHRFHWLTWGHQIVTFDVKTDISAVIKLPSPRGQYKVLLGNSEGYLHCVCVHCSEVRVWVLQDYCKHLWVLKCRLNLVEFFTEHDPKIGGQMWKTLKELSCLPDTSLNPRLLPLAFYEDMFFFKLNRTLFSYNFKTKRLRKHCHIAYLEGYITLTPTILPYSACLPAVGFLKKDQNHGAKSNGN